MFKNKSFGWITAGTLLCVAAVAVVCRLKEGAGSSATAKPTPVAQTDVNEPVAPVAPADGMKDATPVTPLTDNTTSEKPATLAPVADQPFPPISEVKSSQPDMPTDRTAPPSTTPAKVSESPAAPEVAPLVAPPPPPSLADAAPAVKQEPTGSALAPVASPVVAPQAPMSPGKAALDREPQTNLLKPESNPSPAAPIAPVAASDRADVPKPTTEPKPDDAAKQPVPLTPVLEPKLRTAPASLESVPTPGVASPIPTTPAATDPPPSPTTASTTVPAAVTPVKVPMPASIGSYQVQGNGETFRDIAGRSLGDEERWDEIYRLNPELKTRLVVPAGTMVRLPASAAARKPNVVQTGGTEAESEPLNRDKIAVVRPLPLIRIKPRADAAVSTPPLTGTFTMTMDPDHVIQLPKEVCEQLGKTDTILLTPGPDRCLWVCTEASAAKVLERVEKSKVGDGEVQAFRRLYWSQSERTTLNGGVVKVSDKLTEYAGLGSHVVLVGIDDHFELWDAARWRRYSQQTGTIMKTDE